MYTSVIAITVSGYYLMKESFPVIILSPFLIFRFYLCNHLPGIFQLPYHFELSMQPDNMICILKNRYSFVYYTSYISIWFNGIVALLPILLRRFELCTILCSIFFSLTPLRRFCLLDVCLSGSPEPSGHN
jgi:hypothetical protein